MRSESPGRKAEDIDRSRGAEVGPVNPEAPAKPTWTFLTNHAHVLLCVANHPEMRMRDVAEMVGVTERSVQRILTDLEEAGYITRVHHGRQNRYEIHADLPLRHPSERHQQVSALLRLVLGTPE